MTKEQMLQELKTLKDRLPVSTAKMVLAALIGAILEGSDMELVELVHAFVQARKALDPERN